MGACQHASRRDPLAPTCQLKILAAGNQLCCMGFQQTSKYGIRHSSKWNLVRCALSKLRTIAHTCLWMPSVCTWSVPAGWKETPKMEPSCTSWSIPWFLRLTFLSSSFGPQRHDRTYISAFPRDFWQYIWNRQFITTILVWSVNHLVLTQ
jgi:hypothetical protein